MKKSSFLAFALGAVAVLFTACDPKEVDVFGKPVADKDFTVKVTGNNVELKCLNTTVTSVLWEVSDGSQYTDKTSTAFIPVAGDYSVVLSVSNGGDYLASDTVKFSIATSDTEYFNTGVLKALTGGAGGKKTWILDVKEVVTDFIDDKGVKTSSVAYKGSYFHAALDFYGDAVAGGSSTDVWGPWGGTNIYGWGGTPENGSISFDATTGKVTLVLDGVSTESKFGIKKYDRPADYCTISAKNNNGVATSLWDYMLNSTSGKYSYLKTLSAQMADIKFASGFRFPLDKGRITNDANTTYPSQFLKSDLENVTIMHCSDSALVVRVKRTYEGAAEKKCWLLYNFVVKEYTYPSVKTYTHPAKNATIATGTYKLAPVPGGWIGWSSKAMLSAWADRAAFRTDMINWWQFGDPAGASTAANADMAMTALDGTQIVFNAGGTCSIHNSIYKDGAVSATDLATTYTINNGYIAFGDSISVYAVAPSFNKIKHCYVVDVTGSTNLWIGYNNGTKEETQALQLIKQ